MVNENKERKNVNKVNVYILSYDGVVTGSNQLRSYNARVVSKTYGNNPTGDNPTGLIDYYHKYDNDCEKKKEPFFDGFLAHMAFLNLKDKEKYNLSNINYYNIKYVDTEQDNTGELSQLRTTNTGEV